jgi:hypothetical protein
LITLELLGLIFLNKSCAFSQEAILEYQITPVQNKNLTRLGEDRTIVLFSVFQNKTKGVCQK